MLCLHYFIYIYIHNRSILKLDLLLSINNIYHHKSNHGQKIIFYRMRINKNLNLSPNIYITTVSLNGQYINKQTRHKAHCRKLRAEYNVDAIVTIIVCQPTVAEWTFYTTVLMKNIILATMTNCYFYQHWCLTSFNKFSSGISDHWKPQS